jgi:hypothetical protein
MRSCRLACALLLLASSSPAQAPPAPEPVVAVVGATVFPVSTPRIRRGTVIWRGSKIEAVGAELEPPAGAEVHRGEGLYVTPGFVSIVAAGVGLERPQGSIEHSLDPYDLRLRMALAEGITTVQLAGSSAPGGFARSQAVPQGTLSAVVKLAHGDLEAMLVREPAFNYLSLPSRQKELNLFLLRERFRQAAEHIAQVKEAEAKKARAPALRPELAIYVTILKNEQPTVISTSSPLEVELALALQAEHGFDLVLSEPREAWSLAPKLAARRIPVLVRARGPDFNFSFDELVPGEGGMIPIRLPQAFAGAGVEVAILPYRDAIPLSGLAGRDLTSLALDAAYAVRGGMSEEEALQAITLNPARILRVAERIGSLEKGKDADLLILSGHPLDYRTQVLKVFINGKLYYDRASSRLYRHIPLATREPPEVRRY